MRGHGWVGYVPHARLVFPQLTVRDNLLVGQEEHAMKADSRARAGSERVVLRCAREPATGLASLSHRGGTAWPILTAEARCWILTRTLR